MVIEEHFTNNLTMHRYASAYRTFGPSNSLVNIACNKNVFEFLGKIVAICLNMEYGLCSWLANFSPLLIDSEVLKLMH